MALGVRDCEPLRGSIRAARLAALGAAALVLAACGGGEEEEAPPAEAPAAAAQAPGAGGAVTHAALIGQWAPSAAQCSSGARLDVSATMLTNTQSDQTTCTIVSSERDENVITVVGTCSPTPGVLENITFALAAELAAGGVATTMELIQGGLQNGEPFEQQLHLVRCADATP